MGGGESTARNGQKNAEKEVVDYYKILGVSEDATPEDIKVANYKVVTGFYAESISLVFLPAFGTDSSSG